MATALRTLCALGVIAWAAGCGTAEPVHFSHDERLSGEAFADKPRVREAVERVVDDLFGDSPYRLRVPEGSGLPEGGRYLAGLVRESQGAEPGPAVPVAYAPAGAEPGRLVAIAGGQALYHQHCLHCHGVSGDGRGPTALYLYPRPRDYRRGLFKFTSTDYGRKPTREDLRRTIAEGLDGTSMPAFRAQMTPQEIEQVIDYVVFLSMRGEVERVLVEEGGYLSDEDAADEQTIDDLKAIAQDVFAQWSGVDEAVVAPSTPRVPSSPQSIARGRELFLGVSRDVKLECAGCHGNQGQGNGPSWIDPQTFNRYVFTLDPADPEPIRQLAEIAEQGQRRWSDDWGDPLRPADLNRGVYKGGRRPIDLYWRIATGISGTPMPAHAQTLSDPDDIWHLVNFVLALPRDSELLRPDRLQRLGVTAPPTITPTGSDTASR